MKKWIFLIFIMPIILYANIAQVKSVNFIQEGEVSKLIIDLDKEAFAQKVHIKEDKQIILDLKDVNADKRYLRGIDTSEFVGSSVYISPYRKPGTKSDLRFTVQLRDNVRSILENKNNRVILHIENRFGVFSRKKISKSEKNEKIQDEQKIINIPKSFAMNDILENLTQAGVKKYIGKKISINVNNMSYKDLLKIIAETSGFNIIIDDAIGQLKPLTLNLTNLPWDEALDTILNLGNLVAQKHSNILTVKTAAQARAEKLQEIENKKNNRIQEPLVTKVFSISFADSTNLVTIINDYLTKDRGRVQQDKRTNQLIVTDTVEVIEKIKSIMKTLDTQEPQVLIEAKIVEANEGYEFKAGLGIGGIQAGYDPVTPTASLNTNSGSFSISSAPGANAPTLLGANITVFKRLLDLKFNLDLMESENKGRVVTSPKIITENNQKANISSSNSIPVLVTNRDASTGLITETYEDVTANINLDVTPKVTNDGSIALDVSITKEGFSGEAAAGVRPPKTSNAIKTKVLVDNGSTVVIGGLYQTQSSQVDSGVPFLKDLPLIGWLFRSAYNPKKTRSEIIIFLTPRIINQKEAGLVNRSEDALIN
ncbi:MAG: type IV pilus secretin PilQ [Bacteriovoracaceae bacterium]|jgi:type IV pilus assembly protein PilQ|nr:type IV pilus secretin PilQ [Bacteriovoracaceae bacterium]